MSTVGDSWEDIPLAKRRKMLLEQRGMQPKLPPTLSQKPPAPPLSDPSDVIYILGDSEDDDHAANSSPVQRQNPIVGGSGAGAFILVAPQERKNDNDNTLGSDSGGGGYGEERGEEEEVVEEEEEAVATTNETVAQERPPPSPPHLPPPPPPPSRPPLATTKPTKKMKYTKEMLDAPYDFAANREYRRKVGLRNPTRNKRLEPAFGRNKATGAADGRKRKEAVATQEHQIAWKAAALRWREKNKPSAEELKQRAAEQAASRTNVHYTPAAARMSEAATAAACAAATAAAIRKPTSSCPRPPPMPPKQNGVRIIDTWHRGE